MKVKMSKRIEDRKGRGKEGNHRLLNRRDNSSSSVAHHVDDVSVSFLPSRYIFPNRKDPTLPLPFPLTFPFRKEE